MRSPGPGDCARDDNARRTRRSSGGDAVHRPEHPVEASSLMDRTNRSAWAFAFAPERRLHDAEALHGEPVWHRHAPFAISVTAQQPLAHARALVGSRGRPNHFGVTPLADDERSSSEQHWRSPREAGFFFDGRVTP